MVRIPLWQRCGLAVFLATWSLPASRSTGGEQVRPEFADRRPVLKELFLDGQMVQDKRHLVAAFHQPMKRGVVLRCDRPWESVMGGYPTVIRAAGRWHMFYTAGWWDSSTTDLGDPPDGAAMGRGALDCYAYSENGLQWIRPNLRRGELPAGLTRGTPELGTRFPVVPTGMTRDNNGFSPLFPIDLFRLGMDDPQRRFLMSKVSSRFSANFPDFLRDADWEAKFSEPLPGAQPAPQIHVGTLCYEAENRLWVCYGQVIGTDKPSVRVGPEPHQSRQIARFTSTDMVAWDRTVVLQRDEGDHSELADCDEPMFFSARREGNLTIGFITRFHSDRSDRRYTHPLPYVWRKGTTDIELRVSRDGHHWSRVGGGRAWLPHSSDERGFDRLVMMGWGGEGVRVGDQLWFYYTGFDGDHMGHDASGKLIAEDNYVRRGSIALATMRLDGYQSLRAGETPGVLTTEPLTVSGPELIVNADADSHFRNGELRVEVLDVEGRAIEGYTAADCAPMRADAVEFPVRWREGTDLGALLGRQIRLRFHLVRAEIFSYSIYGSAGLP